MTESAIYRRDIAVTQDISALRGKTVLITGATGLVGTCLTDALTESDCGANIIALCRHPEALQNPRVSAMRGDVTQPLPDLPEVDYIIHAASNAHPMAFSQDPVGTMLANILGTKNLLEHLRRQGHGRMLFVSTGEIYGENPSVDAFSEQDFGRIDSMNPRACYPESKRAAETLCASYLRQYGVSCVVARLCYVYGATITPANSRADAQFLRKALAHENIVLKSPGTQMRSYCYAPDAVMALCAILCRGTDGTAYNVANRNSNHTIREYAECLARLAGVQVVFDLPPEAERQGYSQVSRAVQNPDRLEALGWKPRFSLEEGLRHTLAILGGNA